MLRIFNTLTGKKEVFRSIVPGKVGIYVCGPTVYDACHIGHARSVVVFDVIVRYFEAIGYAVKYVRNFTDVDDKIIKRAGELATSTEALSNQYIKRFYEDMDALKVRRATVEPRATDHIQQIIQVVERLIARGHAYQGGGDVFFAVDSFNDYGRLSGQRLVDMQAGARVQVDERKRNPLDFVLWKQAKPGEPMWDSPWGKGRPGWHIECSAMSTHYLDRHFDIHGGGQDLIFPHHENEIAQSRGAFGDDFVNFWIHNGFVKINQEKMSKSRGNFLMIKDVLEKYHPEALRFFLLSNHYRSPVDFTDQAMIEAEGGLEKIYALLKRIGGHVGPGLSEGLEQGPGPLWAGFCEAMDDDFNTARGIGVVFESLRQTNRLLDDINGAPNERETDELTSTRSDLMQVGEVLGILTEAPDRFFEQKKTDTLGRKGVDIDLVEGLIADRSRARREKDWAAADKIRARLSSMGIVIEDRPEGTIWRVE